MRETVAGSGAPEEDLLRRTMHLDGILDYRTRNIELGGPTDRASKIWP